MGLPNINIEFKTAASTAIQRSQKGIVGIILTDANANGAHSLTKISQIPSDLGAENKVYITRAFSGYVSPPKRVIVYVLPSSATSLNDGLNYMASQVIDYLVGPPAITTAMATEIVTWVKEQRADGFIPKAVLPNTAADCEAIINFTTDGIVVDGTTFTAAQYCSRIAGLIAGTPITISSTYAPLPEISDITRLTKDAMDTAIETGKFILYNDGEKVKVGRGVTSFQTTTATKSGSFKKIKIVEAVDMINRDIRKTAQDSYIGKFANSYDNKCLLISAIKEYLTQLEKEGILEAGANTIHIDVNAQENYLIGQGTSTDNMTEQEIKEANTGDKVFLTATISILDAIEDIDLTITL